MFDVIKRRERERERERKLIPKFPKISDKLNGAGGLGLLFMIYPHIPPPFP